MCAPLGRCGVSARKGGGGSAGGGKAAGAGEGAGCGSGAGAGLALPPTGARDKASAPPLPPRATSSFLAPPPVAAAPATRNREPASDACKHIQYQLITLSVSIGYTYINLH